VFDLDVGKMLVVGAVALAVVGPKDLPRVLRAAGQILTRARRFRNDLQKAVTRFADEADLDSIGKELAAVENAARREFAADPAMTMRGRLSTGSSSEIASHVEDGSAAQYASPEMAAYLAQPHQAMPLAQADESHPESPALESRTGRISRGPVGREADLSALI
jgi:sec-independent protein translocase protein TatB